jgi:hypothetical protein
MLAAGAYLMTFWVTELAPGALSRLATALSSVIGSFKPVLGAVSVTSDVNSNVEVQRGAVQACVQRGAVEASVERGAVQGIAGGGVSALVQPGAVMPNARGTVSACNIL